MMLKIGDRVRFLSEKGGGIVVKILNNNMVTVHTDDEFDIPCLIKDLVKIEQEDSSKALFHTLADKEKALSHVVQIADDNNNAIQVQPESSSKIKRIEQRDKLQEGIYLAYMPENINMMMLSDLDVFLVNNTAFDVLFTLIWKNSEGKCYGTDYDIIPSCHKNLLSVVKRSLIETMSEGAMQLIFHANKEQTLFEPLCSSFKLPVVRFENEDNYLEYNILENPSLILEIAKTSDLRQIGFQDKSSITKSTRASQVLPKALITQYLTSPYEAVIDLHIEALVKENHRMAQNDMLQYQLNYFIRCLESALKHNLHKVTFIHGVGNGILKNELIAILKNYRQVSVQQASIKKYGLGAIDVIINSDFPFQH